MLAFVYIYLKKRVCFTFVHIYLKKLVYFTFDHIYLKKRVYVTFVNIYLKKFVYFTFVNIYMYLLKLEYFAVVQIYLMKLLKVYFCSDPSKDPSLCTLYTYTVMFFFFFSIHLMKPFWTDLFKHSLDIFIYITFVAFKRETHNSNISIMYQYYALYHYVNIYHVFHVLFMRFMFFHMYCLLWWTCLFTPNKIFWHKITAACQDSGTRSCLLLELRSNQWHMLTGRVLKDSFVFATTSRPL